MSEEIKNKLQVLAEDLLERYFEKPENHLFWRHQLRVEFIGSNKVWFGNLYFNGGKRVEIRWDCNNIFIIELYHLAFDIKEKILERFIYFLEQLDMDCFLLRKIETLEHISLIPFGTNAEYFSRILAKFKKLSYFTRKDEINCTFICIKENERRIPIFLNGINKMNDTDDNRNKSIIIAN